MVRGSSDVLHGVLLGDFTLHAKDYGTRLCGPPPPLPTVQMGIKWQASSHPINSKHTT